MPYRNLCSHKSLGFSPKFVLSSAPNMKPVWKSAFPPHLHWTMQPLIFLLVEISDNSGTDTHRVIVMQGEARSSFSGPSFMRIKHKGAKMIQPTVFAALHCTPQPCPCRQDEPCPLPRENLRSKVSAPVMVPLGARGAGSSIQASARRNEPRFPALS